MEAFQVSIPAGELLKRMQQRLAGGDVHKKVVWQDGRQQVLLHLDSLRIRAVDGWLLCNLDLETDPTKRQLLQFVYFLGQAGDADGLHASASINAATIPSSQLADRWGPDVQRLLWDAVLDGIAAAVQHVREQKQNLPMTLQGFSCDNDILQVQVLTGAS